MAGRCLPFLHVCIRELILLDISTPLGATACWLFLACMEVLQTCDRHNQADQVESYSANTAALWAYASQKVFDINKKGKYNRLFFYTAVSQKKICKRHKKRAHSFHLNIIGKKAKYNYLQ